MENYFNGKLDGENLKGEASGLNEFPLPSSSIIKHILNSIPPAKNKWLGEKEKKNAFHYILLYCHSIKLFLLGINLSI